jgi:CheY-like chemotaxis protein
VELMGGNISVESQYGKGSTFRVNIWQGCIGREVIDAETVEALKKFRYDVNKSTTAEKLVRPDLSWANVLVVDDSPTNLDVAKGILRKYKMNVDCVLNGQDALDRIRVGQPHYHAIFMDHMMPGMDGIETTRLIRRHDSDYARNIPIIALTANAVAGNEQMFLNEGFQAFVSKPINVVKLDAAVKEHIGNRHDAELMPVSPDIAPESPTLPVSRCPEGINMTLALSLYEDDMEMLTDIMRSYAQNVPTELARMRGLTEDGLAEYAIDIHTMKGASSGIGAKELTVRAKKMERMAKAGDYESVAALNPQFCDDAEALVASIREWLDSLNSTPEAP